MSTAEHLLRACRSGRLSAVTQCLQLGADVNAAWTGDQMDRTPLLAALDSGHLEVAEHLIDRGADVNRPDRRGTTPLHAAARGNSVAGIRLLISRGADRNAQDSAGRSPLMLAVLAGALAAATELTQRSGPGLMLELVTRANSTSGAGGDTAFTLAAATGSVAMLGLLVRAGADVRRTNLRGKDGLEIARDVGNLAAERFLVELFSRNPLT